MSGGMYVDASGDVVVILESNEFVQVGNVGMAKMDQKNKKEDGRDVRCWREENWAMSEGDEKGFCHGTGQGAIHLPRACWPMWLPQKLRVASPGKTTDAALLYRRVLIYRVR